MLDRVGIDEKEANITLSAEFSTASGILVETNILKKVGIISDLHLVYVCQLLASIICRCSLVNSTSVIVWYCR